VDGQGAIIRLNNSIRDLRRRDNRGSGHHTVGELLTDLRNEKGAHTSTSATTKRVSNLETLEAVATFGLATNDIKNLIYQLSALSVMPLCPVVASASLAKDKVVRTEELAERTGANSVYSARFKINEDSTRDIFVTGSLTIKLGSCTGQERSCLPH
jgi:hypothetical protein